MKLKPIKDKKKITALFEKGRVINGENISIRVHKFKGEEPDCVISVPKKSFPLAVKRNLIKRRLKAALARCPANKDGGSFFLIYLSKQIIPTKTLEEELNTLIKKMQ